MQGITFHSSVSPDYFSPVKPGSVKPNLGRPPHLSLNLYSPILDNRPPIVNEGVKLIGVNEEIIDFTGVHRLETRIVRLCLLSVLDTS